MRSHNDLFGAFDSVDTDSVDPDEMLARIYTGSAHAQRARHRTIAVASVAAAAVLIAMGAAVIPSLGTDRPDRGQVATTPTLPQLPVEAQGGSPTTLNFSLAEIPQGYTFDGAPAELDTEFADTFLGQQTRTYLFGSDYDTDHQALDIGLYSPKLSGLPAPHPTGESIAATNPTLGPITFEVIEADSEDDDPYPSFGIGWQIDPGQWLTVTSNAPGDLARQQVLEAVAQLQFGAESLAFPLTVGYIPADYELTGSGSRQSRGAPDEARLGFNVGAPEPYQDGVSMLADIAAGVPEGHTPNTTVGPYQAELFSAPFYSPPLLFIFDVEGFMLQVSVDAQLDEAELIRIAESITVIPGAATDPSVWTDQPLG